MTNKNAGVAKCSKKMQNKKAGLENEGHYKDKTTYSGN